MDLKLRQWLLSISLLQRIVIANTVIIVTGAIAGTLLAVHLANQVGELSLILLFVSVGVLLSFVINWLLVRAALVPFHQLRDKAGQVVRGGATVRPESLVDADRDVRQLADALSQLVQELEKRNNELQALSQQIINAQEEERRRIARSLHDDTNQNLSMLIVRLERMEQRPPASADDLHIELAACREIAQQILRELRNIIYGLRPTILDDLGLVPAMRWYGRLILEEAGVRPHFDLPDENPALTDQQSEALFRITQEAVTNIVHHAGLCQATISLSQQNGDLVLMVADDGCGFDPGSVSEHRLGILGMAERTALIQGSFDLDSTPGLGTQIQVRIPLGSNVRGDNDQD